MNKLYSYLTLISNCSNRALIEIIQYLQDTGELPANVKDTLKFSKDDTLIEFDIDNNFPSNLTMQEYNTILFLLTELIPQYATMNNMRFFVTISKNNVSRRAWLNVPNIYPDFKMINKNFFMDGFNQIIHICK